MSYPLCLVCTLRFGDFNELRHFSTVYFDCATKVETFFVYMQKTKGQNLWENLMQQLLSTYPFLHTFGKWICKESIWRV